MTEFWQFVLIGLVTGSLYALIALGYTMVYGIIELINFAHGDLFMLGSFLALQVGFWVADERTGPRFERSGGLAIAPDAPGRAALLCRPQHPVDRTVYRPLRSAPKMAGMVSAIGVSFIFMNIGLFWFGPVDVNFPNLIVEHQPSKGPACASPTRT